MAVELILKDAKSHWNKLGLHRDPDPKRISGWWVKWRNTLDAETTNPIAAARLMDQLERKMRDET